MLLAARVEDKHLVPLHRELNGVSQVNIRRLRPGKKQMLAADVHDIAALDGVDLLILDVV